MTGEASMETRDWAELPRDTLATVYGKLDLAGTVVAFIHVCRSWRCVAAHEPALIRAGNDGQLLSLAGHLSSVRILRLVSCYSISNEGFVEAIKKFTLLEELEISLCKNILAEAIVAVGKACPHLERFRLSNDCFYCFEDEHTNNQEARAISTMRELRSLQLFGNDLDNKGLTSILDKCPHLEFLDIRHCFNVKMDTALKAKCARIATLRLPDNSTADYEFVIKNPIRCSGLTHYVWEENWANIPFEEDEDENHDFFPPEDEDLLEVDDAPHLEEDEDNIPFEEDEDDNHDFFPPEDEDLLEVDDAPHLEEDEEIPEDEESMMLDYYAMLDENGWV